MNKVIAIIIETKRNRERKKITSVQDSHAVNCTKCLIKIKNTMHIGYTFRIIG